MIDRDSVAEQASGNACESAAPEELPPARYVQYKLGEVHPRLRYCHRVVEDHGEFLLARCGNFLDTARVEEALAPGEFARVGKAAPYPPCPTCLMPDVLGSDAPSDARAPGEPLVLERAVRDLLVGRARMLQWSLDAFAYHLPKRGCGVDDCAQLAGDLTTLAQAISEKVREATADALR
jgi:hypothetical protein